MVFDVGVWVCWVFVVGVVVDDFVVMYFDDVFGVGGDVVVVGD